MLYLYLLSNFTDVSSHLLFICLEAGWEEIRKAWKDELRPRNNWVYTSQEQNQFSWLFQCTLHSVTDHLKALNVGIAPLTLFLITILPQISMTHAISYHLLTSVIIPVARRRGMFNLTMFAWELPGLFWFDELRPRNHWMYTSQQQKQFSRLYSLTGSLIVLNIGIASLNFIWSWVTRW